MTSLALCQLFIFTLQSLFSIRSCILHISLVKLITVKYPSAMEEGELMSKEEMALLLNRIVSCSVEKAGKNYGDARKALHELAFLTNR